MGPATAPWMTRKAINSCSEPARPHISEAMENRITDAVNSRTAPKRWLNHPVNGTVMALATPKEVITQVTCVVDTPRSPPIADKDTFAIEVSSTFMNVASDSDRVPNTMAAPFSGGNSSGAAMPGDSQLRHYSGAAADTSVLSTA